MINLLEFLHALTQFTTFLSSALVEQKTLILHNVFNMSGGTYAEGKWSSSGVWVACSSQHLPRNETTFQREALSEIQLLFFFLIQDVFFNLPFFCSLSTPYFSLLSATLKEGWYRCLFASSIWSAWGKACVAFLQDVFHNRYCC